MEGLTHYDAILQCIASKFYSDLPPDQKPHPEACLETFKGDLLGFTASAAQDPAWMLWIKVQERRILMSKKELDTPRVLRMTPEEIFFLTEAALHLRNHGYIIRLRKETLENVSAWRIERNIKVATLRELGLPDYLWIEWPRFEKNAHSPWVTRTIGVLISRLVLLDAPRHRLVPMTETSSANNDFTLELIRALAQNTIDGIACLGYQLIIVQQDDHGYRYIPCMFGHELTEPLTDMLVLHKEMSDRDQRKFRQAEQAWGNVAIRLLLFTAHHRSLLNPEHPIFTEEPSTWTFPSSAHTFFSQEMSGKRGIGIRPKYHAPFKPFSVINQ